MMPNAALSDLGAAAVDTRQPCAWCGVHTARTGPDGQPRHGWCETPAAYPWQGVARPPRHAETPVAAPLARPSRYAPVCCNWWAENEPGQPCPECNR